MPSSDKTSSTTTTQKVELPAWVDQGGQENYGLAKDIATTPYTPYTGNLVAGMNNDYRTAEYDNLMAGENYLGQGVGRSNDMLNAVANSRPSNVSAGGYKPSTVSPSNVSAASVGLNGYNPMMVQAQQVKAPVSVKDILAASIKDADINKYMNPYENQVVQGAETAGQQSIAASQRANSDNAIAAGAFGSSRHGVTEGVTAAQGAQDIANTVGQIRSAGFNTALSAAQSDASRADAASQSNQNKDMAYQDLFARVGMANQSADLSAQTSNQGALAQRTQMQLSADQGNQTTGLQASMANQSGGLQASIANQGALADAAKMRLAAATANQNAELQHGNQLLGSAGQFLANGQASGTYSQALGDRMNQDALLAQSTDQQQLASNYDQWQKQQDYPTEQLNLRLAALGMTPYGKTTTGTSTTTESGGDNPFMTILGGAMGMKNLFGFSDPKLKKNVKTEGKGPNGLTVKSFDYRQDKGVKLPRGRQIGYMADEVERKMPDAVRRVPIGNGKTARQVDYAKTGRPGVFGFGKRKSA